MDTVKLRERKADPRIRQNARPIDISYLYHLDDPSKKRK